MRLFGQLLENRAMFGRAGIFLFMCACVVSVCTCFCTGLLQGKTQGCRGVVIACRACRSFLRKAKVLLLEHSSRVPSVITGDRKHG